MKRVLLVFISISLLFMIGCSGIFPAEPSVRVIAPPDSSPSPTPSPSINIPVGPAKTHMFGLPWTKTDRVLPLSDALRYSDQWTRLCYEGLFELDETLTAKPLLCSSYTAENNSVYVFALRPDVSFHNGEIMTASDVVYSFKEAAKQDSPYSSRLETMSSVKELDGLTVEVALTRPMSRFTALLDFPIVWGGTPQPDIAPGTGPYSFNIGEDGSYLLEYGGWWQNKALPLPRIELVDIEDQDDLAYCFQNGAVSVLSLDPYDQTAPQIHSGMETWRASSTNMAYIGFNSALKPLDDPQTRKAMSMALDRAALTKAAYGSWATATAIPAPPGSELAGVTISVPEFDPGAAALLLEELGYSDQDYDEVLEYQASKYLRRPFELDILVNSENSARVEIARLCADQLTQLGIKATLRCVQWDSYIAALEAGTYGLYVGEVKLSADLSVERFVGRDGALNYSRYKDEELDGLLDILASRPAYAQKTALRNVYQHIVDTAPFITLCFRETALGSQRGLLHSPTPLGWNCFFRFSQWLINE